MGVFRIEILMWNTMDGQARWGGDGVRTLNALVDTGATHSMAPGALLYELNIDPHSKSDVTLADGTEIEMKVATAVISCQGRTGWCPVYVGPEDSEVLLGATSLEILGFKVNPVDQTLEPVSLRG